jgi:dCMP deaminase
MTQLKNQQIGSDEEKLIESRSVVSSSCTWDQYFMTMAYLVSMRSKDPSTRVGAVIVGADHEVRSTGYNGLPRNIRDDLTRYEDSEFKNLASNHAEETCILHCARIGVSTKGCTLYTTWQPCAHCGKMIIQAGIVRVVYDKNFPGNDQNLQENWQYSMAVSLSLMEEAGVKISCIDGKLIKLEGLYKGRKFDPFR